MNGDKDMVIRMLEKLFKLKEKSTNVKAEIVAGFTTFMTMAYILAVNPSILGYAVIDTVDGVVIHTHGYALYR